MVCPTLWLPEGMQHAERTSLFNWKITELQRQYRTKQYNIHRQRYGIKTIRVITNKKKQFEISESTKSLNIFLFPQTEAEILFLVVRSCWCFELHSLLRLFF